MLLRKAVRGEHRVMEGELTSEQEGSEGERA